ncbi:MAG: flagellar biosynthesis anti-sigma factor FlgM [Defluviitaleaceae bacterium]|nr:flagellar biosynthesis anti-sigma factor FlgM [Defluviitaleaceae bacterium]
MRIDNIYSPQKIARPVNAVSRGKADRTLNTNFADAYTPSSLATDFNVARKAVANTPDIRTDKVDDIINRINSGDYNVSADDVAGKILDQIG